MSSYQLSFKNSAKKELAKLDYPMQQHIKKKLQILVSDYDSLGNNIKKLSGLDDLFRLRIADYRVIFQKNDEKIYILIVRIGHRKEVYRNLN